MSPCFGLFNSFIEPFLRLWKENHNWLRICFEHEFSFLFFFLLLDHLAPVNLLLSSTVQIRWFKVKWGFKPRCQIDSIQVFPDSGVMPWSWISKHMLTASNCLHLSAVGRHHPLKHLCKRRDSSVPLCHKLFFRDERRACGFSTLLSLPSVLSRRVSSPGHWRPLEHKVLLEALFFFLSLPPVHQCYTSTAPSSGHHH